jgi:hypothetical protein
VISGNIILFVKINLLFKLGVHGIGESQHRSPWEGEKSSTPERVCCCINAASGMGIYPSGEILKNEFGLLMTAKIAAMPARTRVMVLLLPVFPDEKASVIFTRTKPTDTGRIQNSALAKRTLGDERNQQINPMIAGTGIREKNNPTFRASGIKRKNAITKTSRNKENTNGYRVMSL